MTTNTPDAPTHKERQIWPEALLLGLLVAFLSMAWRWLGGDGDSRQLFAWTDLGYGLSACLGSGIAREVRREFRRPQAS